MKGRFCEKQRENVHFSLKFTPKTAPVTTTEIVAGFLKNNTKFYFTKNYNYYCK